MWKITENANNYPERRQWTHVGHLPYASPCARDVQVFKCLIPPHLPERNPCPHSVVGDTGSRRRLITCPRSHGEESMEPGLRLSCVTSHSLCSYQPAATRGSRARTHRPCSWVGTPSLKRLLVKHVSDVLPSPLIGLGNISSRRRRVWLLEAGKADWE